MRLIYKPIILLLCLGIILFAYSCAKKEPFKIPASVFPMDKGCPAQSDLKQTLKATSLAPDVYEISGGSVYLVDPTTGQMRSNNWCPGVEQTLIGNLEMAGYKFQSDLQTPLIFKVTKDGYVYQQGKGLVTTPKGEQIQLGTP